MQLNKTLMAAAIGLLGFVSAGPASADFVFNQAITESGTGLGAVPTVLTVLDNGATGNGTESGCVSSTLGSPNTVSFTCLNGLQGGDNQAINNLVLLSSLSGLTSASQLALIVNINEPGNDGEAVLTDLYLSLYNATTGALLSNHQYIGPDLTLEQVSGIGGAGNVFTLTGAEQLQIDAECPVLSQCLVGGGIQFANGSTAGGSETMFVSFTTTTPPPSVPEPATVLLLGSGMLAIALGRRRRKEKQES